MSRPEQNIDYKLPQDAYVTFDALTLKDFIIKRLNTNENFTDQIYDGSNLSSIIDIIAYSYHVLMFYLNTTASESTFSQATLYENMNKIVNLVGYKPTGKHTSLCTLNATANANLPVGSYTIRKYSYFLVDDIQYTFLKNYTFTKTETATQTLDSINNNVVLYQGTVEQYPVYVASGEEYETFPIVVTNIVDSTTLKFIANGTISVYVKEATSGKYYEYAESNSLYLAEASDRSYDLRLNENGNYEVKFGNGVFGRKLEQGDEVIVTPCTWISSASCILMQNAVPIFCDIESDTLGINPELLSEQITSRTKAIILVHILGYPAQVDKVFEISSKY